MILIKICNENTMCQVRYLGETFKSVEVKPERRQGDFSTIELGIRTSYKRYKR